MAFISSWVTPGISRKETVFFTKSSFVFDDFPHPENNAKLSVRTSVTHIIYRIPLNVLLLILSYAYFQCMVVFYEKCALVSTYAYRRAALTSGANEETEGVNTLYQSGTISSELSLGLGAGFTFFGLDLDTEWGRW